MAVFHVTRQKNSGGVLVDTELMRSLLDLIYDKLDTDVDIRVWNKHGENPAENLAGADAFFTYGHPIVDGAVMDSMPNLCAISNFGVGVDHINLTEATARGIPVGNTSGFVDGATAYMTIALMTAAARNVVQGDHFARGPEFTHYDPNLWHGQEVYGSTWGIVGMARIGREYGRGAGGDPLLSAVA